MSLEQYRSEIDKIDKALLKLYEQRMGVVKQVAIFKAENEVPVTDKGREAQVIGNKLESLKNDEIKEEVINLFKYIIHLSKGYEHRIIEALDNKDIKKTAISEIDENSRIGYYGVEGSFTHEASKHVGNFNNKKGYTSFEDTFLALNNEEIDYAILPIENSSTGAICDVYDLLLKYKFFICKEIIIKIEQNLIGLPSADIDSIDEIFSHEQGFAQCREFLSKYPKIKHTTYNSTAQSVMHVSKLNDNKKAAIGSAFSAEIYGMTVIAPKINTWDKNYTRFVLINKQTANNDRCNKISVIISLSHATGSLYNSLSFFNENNINIEKIESRPNLETPFSYNFFIDFTGNINDENVINFFTTLKNNNIDCILLGCYENIN